MSSPSPSFSSLGLSAESLRLLERAKYLQPTPIQEKAIPPALAGQDVIGCAATGTGKTAAFLLPMVERLVGKKGTRGLVLAPTRELAIQIAEHCATWGNPRQIRHALLIGGVGMNPQIQALKQDVNVLIATPGRLVDHLQEGRVNFRDIEMLVLDEADRMLDMGFQPQLKRILKALPVERQTLLFSATMAHEVADFAKQHLKHPVRVEVNRSGTTAQRATQELFEVTQAEKTPLLLALLDSWTGSTLVFTRTKHRADKVAKQLARYQHSVARIHSDRSQAQRQAALEGFRRGQFRILVATDIAARGLDVADIEHVVNYDLPHLPEDYVHRVGRTARASASGRATAFCSPEERPQLKDIEKLLKTPIPRGEVPREDGMFQTELKAAQERQKHPGPKQKAKSHRAAPPPRKHGSAQNRRFSGKRS